MAAMFTVYTIVWGSFFAYIVRLKLNDRRLQYFEEAEVSRRDVRGDL